MAFFHIFFPIDPGKQLHGGFPGWMGQKTLIHRKVWGTWGQPEKYLKSAHGNRTQVFMIFQVEHW